MGKRKLRGAGGRFVSADTVAWVRAEKKARALDKKAPKPFAPPKSLALKAGSYRPTWAYLASKSRPEVKPTEAKKSSIEAKRRGYEVKQLIAARKQESRRKSTARKSPGKPAVTTKYKLGNKRINRSVWVFGWPHGLDLAKALTYVYEGRGPFVRMNAALIGVGEDGPNSIGSATESPAIIREWLQNYEKLPSYSQWISDVDEDTIRVEVEVLELKLVKPRKRGPAIVYKNRKAKHRRQR